MPTPTYGDRSETDPSLPDENEPARRSKAHVTKNDPKIDAAIDPATVKPAEQSSEAEND